MPLHLPDEHTAYAFHTGIPVRISDLVGGLHVANHALVSCLTEAQMQFFKALGFADLTVEGLIPVNRHLEVDFISEAHYGDVLEAHVAIETFRADDYDIVCRLVNQHTGKPVCCARMGMVFYDYAARARATVPDAFISAYRALSGQYDPD